MLTRDRSDQHSASHGRRLMCSPNSPDCSFNLFPVFHSHTFYLELHGILQRAYIASIHVCIDISELNGLAFLLIFCECPRTSKCLFLCSLSQVAVKWFCLRMKMCKPPVETRAVAVLTQEVCYVDTCALSSASTALRLSRFCGEPLLFQSTTSNVSRSPSRMIPKTTATM